MQAEFVKQVADPQGAVMHEVPSGGGRGRVGAERGGEGIAPPLVGPLNTLIESPCDARHLY